MNKLNLYLKQCIKFFENRSILFYIFWLSFFTGEIFFQILKRIKGCSPFFNENKLIGYGFDHFQVVPCDPIEKGFIEACMLVCLLIVVAYFLWYVFKCLRYVFRLGFKRWKKYLISLEIAPFYFTSSGRVFGLVQ